MPADANQHNIIQGLKLGIGLQQGPHGAGVTLLAQRDEAGTLRLLLPPR